MDIEEQKAIEEAQELEKKENEADDWDYESDDDVCISVEQAANKQMTLRWWRQFIPGQGLLVGCHLSRLDNRTSYCGHYPDPACPTHTAKWEGVLKQLPEIEALNEVLDWMWKRHFLNGHGKKPDTVGSPTENELRAAIAMLARKRATASKRKQQNKV